MKTVNKFVVVVLAATADGCDQRRRVRPNPTGSSGGGTQTRPRLAARNPEPGQTSAPSSEAKSAAPVDSDEPANDQPTKSSDAKSLDSALLTDTGGAKDATSGSTSTAASLPADVPGRYSQ